MNRVYGLPFNGTRIFQSRVAKPLQSWTRTHISTPAAKALAPVTSALRRLATACCCCYSRQQRQHSDVVDTLGLPPVLGHSKQTAAAAAHSEAGSSSGMKLPAVNNGDGGGLEGTTEGSSTHAAVEIDIAGLEGKDVDSKPAL